MTTLEKLIAELSKESPNIELCSSYTTDVSNVVTSLQTNQTKSDTQITTLKVQNKTYKDMETTFKTALGVDSIDVDKIDELLNANKSDDIKEVEARHFESLRTLATVRDSVQVEHEQTLLARDSELKDVLFDLEIYKVAGDINAVENALPDIHRNLKEGGVLEDGVIKFKNADGSVVRNKDQIEATLTDRLEELKETKKYLFLSDVQPSGGDRGTNHGIGGNGDMSDFAKRKAEELKKLNYGRQ